MTTRRCLLAFAGALLASPALVRTPGLLMPVKPWREGHEAFLTAQAYCTLRERFHICPGDVVRITMLTREEIALVSRMLTTGEAEWGVRFEGAA